MTRPEIQFIIFSLHNEMLEDVLHQNQIGKQPQSAPMSRLEAGNILEDQAQIPEQFRSGKVPSGIRQYFLPNNKGNRNRPRSLYGIVIS